MLVEAGAVDGRASLMHSAARGSDLSVLTLLLSQLSSTTPVVSHPKQPTLRRISWKTELFAPLLLASARWTLLLHSQDRLRLYRTDQWRSLRSLSANRTRRNN